MRTKLSALRVVRRRRDRLRQSVAISGEGEAPVLTGLEQGSMGKRLVGRSQGSGRRVLGDAAWEGSLILEGRVSFVEGLQIKLDNAAQKGLLYYSLATHF